MKSVKLYTAYFRTEAIKIRLLFDRAGIPYITRNEMAFDFIGYPTSPMEFHVSEQMYELAQQRLEEMFAIEMEALPEACPACDTPTQKGSPDCPSCGLYLV